MPLRHAVLALLAEGPSHGYDLRVQFEDAIGPQWGPLNIGHVYQLLDRLGRDGMVSSHREEQTEKPDRVVYALTDAGREELRQWLTGPTERPAGHRDDFFLKLMAAARSDDATLVPEVLRRQRRQLLTELRDLARLRDTTGDAVTTLLIAAAELRLRADLAFTDAAEEQAERGALAVPRGPVADLPESRGRSRWASDGP